MSGNVRHVVWSEEEWIVPGSGRSQDVMRALVMYLSHCVRVVSGMMAWRSPMSSFWTITSLYSSVPWRVEILRCLRLVRNAIMVACMVRI